MTTREAGRHRRRVSPQRPPSLLLSDYEYPRGAGVCRNNGLALNGSRLLSPVRARGPRVPRLGASPALTVNMTPVSGAGPAGGRRALRAVARDRRAFVIALSATLAGIAAAAGFGVVVPLRSTWTPSGGHGAAGGRPPQASVPWSAAPLGSPSGQAMPQNPVRAGQMAPSTRPSAPGTWPPASGTWPSASGTWPSAPRTTPAAAASPVGPATAADPTAPAAPAAGTGRAAAGARATAASRPATAASQPKVVVRYLVDSQWLGGFQGQVQIVNHGPRPLAGWQIVIALPGDAVTSVSNAAGFVSNHILLLQPAFTAEVVPPHGGILNVFFVAQGPETAPAACAFDGIPCT